MVVEITDHSWTFGGSGATSEIIFLQALLTLFTAAIHNPCINSRNSKKNMYEMPKKMAKMDPIPLHNSENYNKSRGVWFKKYAAFSNTVYARRSLYT